MTVDEGRIKKFLFKIRKNFMDLKTLVEQNELSAGFISLKAVKYVLIELAEAISAVLQHVLAREKGIAVSGYVDTIIKAKEQKLILKELF